MSGPFEPNRQQPPFGQPYGTPPASGNTPTTPGWGYGEPGPTTTPGQYQPVPGQPWGQSSPTMPGGFAPPPAAMPRKSRRGLWITLGVILALLVVGGGAGVYAFGTYVAPAAEAGIFCGHLKAANYTAAYNDLSAAMQAQVSADEFAKGAQFIELTEGNITRCAQSAGSNAYSYSFGAKKATLNVTMSRSISGTLVGNIGLVQEGGAWKVGSIDTSVLGINLGALKTAGAFCAALQTQNYTAAYALLSSMAKQPASADLFAKVLGLQDTIDGKITACALNGFTVGASDTGAVLNVTFTRATLGARQGIVSLTVEGGAWKINSVADSLNGTDVGALLVAEQFCADLVANKFSDAYALLSQSVVSHIGSLDSFVADFTEPAPYAWAGCTPDLTTYKVSGTEAQFNGTLNEQNTDTKSTHNFPYAFYFVKEGGVWKFDGLGKPNV